MNWNREEESDTDANDMEQAALTGLSGPTNKDQAEMAEIMSKRRQRQKWLCSRYVLLFSMCLNGVLMFVMNMMSSSHNDAPPPAAPVTPPQVQEGWVRPPIIYGLAHIAKTGGTTINGELANHFERVCGNKGYSYDAYMTNERFQQTVEKRANDDSKKKNHLVMRADQGDSLTKLWPSFNRGNTPRKWMDEVGYDDCDYVAIETKFIEQWQGVIDQAQTRMEKT